MWGFIGESWLVRVPRASELGMVASCLVRTISHSTRHNFVALATRVCSLNHLEVLKQKRPVISLITPRRLQSGLLWLCCTRLSVTK